MLQFTHIETRLGRLFLARTHKGLVQLSWKCQQAQFVAEIERIHNDIAQHEPAAFVNIKTQLDEYFEGRRQHFDFAFDVSSLTDFQQRVLATTVEIPFGEVISYGEVARRLGNVQSVRAVGQALGRNPVPVVVPCHRVVAAGGQIGGFSGGLDLKRELFRVEGIVLDAPTQTTQPALF